MTYRIPPHEPVEPITIPDMVSTVLADADMPLNSIAVMAGVRDRYGVRVPHAEIKATLHDHASHGRAVRLTDDRRAAEWVAVPLTSQI